MTDEENGQYLFDLHLSEMRCWRYMKCEQMLETINQMMRNELARRIKNDPAKV